MPLSKDHKARTRARIVESARRLFKTRGYERVGIDAIMADAGLTRGGFYAHFSSKEDLFAEAVGEVIMRAGLERHEKEGAPEPEDWRQKIVDFYLSREHRDHQGGGCPMAALSADVAHTSKSVRDVYTSVFLDMVRALENRMPADHANPRDAAFATVAQCVGSMVIARAVASDDVADEVFAAGRYATRLIAG